MFDTRVEDIRRSKGVRGYDCRDEDDDALSLLAVSSTGVRGGVCRSLPPPPSSVVVLLFFMLALLLCCC